MNNSHTSACSRIAKPLREKLSKSMSDSFGSVAAVDKRILSVCFGEFIADG
jgi:hypothetical protein